MSDTSAPESRRQEATWGDQERARRRWIAGLTLIEKLDWLEEAHRVARHLEASRRERYRPGQQSE